MRGGVLRFQWLKDYQELDEQILYIKWNLNKSKLELDRWINGDLANVKLENNSRSSSLEENIDKMLNELDRLSHQKKELITLVDSFAGVENQIVKLKYIDNLTLEDIAEITGYSSSYIRKKHSDIRNTLKFVDEYESRRDDRQNKINEIEYYETGILDDNQLSLF